MLKTTFEHRYTLYLYERYKRGCQPVINERQYDKKIVLMLVSAIVSEK